MYNMSYNRLKEYKGFQGNGSLLDFMGRQELAAHQFRVTQTEAMIRNENIRGQSALERAAQKVGREVRETMIRTSGTYPENLPIAEDIKKVRTKLKRANKELQELDDRRTNPSLSTLQSTIPDPQFPLPSRALRAACREFG